MEAYVGDVGGEIVIDCYYLASGDVKTALDISLATIRQLGVTRADGSTETWACDLVGTTQMRYVIESGDLPQAEIITLRPYVAWPDGSHYHGSSIELEVRAYD